MVTATFAYFVAQTGEGKSTDIKINASTVDTLTFETGSALSLNLNQDNFANGAGNQTWTTFAKAMFTANNKTNTATEHYYMYLYITSNDFTYTQNENTPEILLTIKDASGNAVTSISGLTYKTVTDGKGASLSGFDITNQSGLLALFSNREITTTSSKTEQWNITVTFVNYNADQSANAGKSFKSKVLIQKDELLLTDYVLSQYTGTQGDNGIYYHNSSLYDYATSDLLGTDGDYAGIGNFDTSKYKGSLTTINTYYWNNATSTNIWSESLLNKTNLNTNYINNIGSTWANKIATTIWKIGGNTVTNIYGVIPSVTYQNEVVNPTPGKWSTTGETEYSAKIGLMYVSDYGFAASPSAWTTTLEKYNTVDDKGFAIRNLNWMLIGSEDWLILRNSALDVYAFCFYNSGEISADGVGGSTGSYFGIRVVFNLEPTITYISGIGTSSDPIRIN